MKSLGRGAMMFVAMIGPAGAAGAADYVVNYEGVVRYSVTRDGADGPFINNPAGAQVVTGDRFAATLRFSTEGAVRAGLFDADPTINIYTMVKPTSVTITMGSYTWEEVLPGDDLSVQLWDNYNVGPGQTNVDSQSFTLRRNPYADPFKVDYPFGMGAGRISEAASFYMFDSSGTARDSDSIERFASATAFSSKAFEYSLHNGENQRFFMVATDVTGASISAVPEPATWASLIVGVGMAGAGLRYRRRAVRITVAAA